MSLHASQAPSLTRRASGPVLLATLLLGAVNAPAGSPPPDDFQSTAQDLPEETELPAATLDPPSDPPLFPLQEPEAKALRRELEQVQAQLARRHHETAERIAALEQAMNQAILDKQAALEQAAALERRTTSERAEALAAANATALQFSAVIRERDAMKTEIDALTREAKALREQSDHLRQESDDFRQQAAETLAKYKRLYSEAESLRDALARKEQALETQRQQWQYEVRNLYRVRRDEDAVRRGDAMREAMTNPFNPALAWSLNDVALLMFSEGRIEDAEPLFRRALFILEQARGRTHAAQGTVRQHLADLCWRRGDLESASELYRHSVENFEKSLGSKHPRLAVALNGWATVLRDQNQFDDAERLYRRCLEIYDQHENHPDAAAPLHNLGLLLAAQNRLDEAEVLLMRALHTLEKASTASASRRSLVMRSLAGLYATKGDLDTALVYEKKATEGMESP